MHICRLLIRDGVQSIESVLTIRFMIYNVDEWNLPQYHGCRAWQRRVMPGGLSITASLDVVEEHE